MIAGGLIAFFVALFVSLVMCPAILPWLRRLRMGQAVRSDGPSAHLRKAGTPTMGGLVFIPAIALALIVSGTASRLTVTALAVTATFAAVGWLDDYTKAVRGRSLGLRARTKVLIGIIVSVALGYIVLTWGRDPSVAVPLLASSLDLGSLFVPFVVVVLLGTTNAVNLTDGLDGLAAGLTLVSGIGYAAVLWIVGAVELIPFILAVAGACAGFLPMNRHPAAMFMGDTGSFALGGALAATAVLSGTELLLPILGGVFVVETLSVIAQVAAFRLTGRRILLMSPLHHHLELRGWHETRVVARLLAWGAVCAVAAVALAYTL